MKIAASVWSDFAACDAGSGTNKTFVILSAAKNLSECTCTD